MHACLHSHMQPIVVTAELADILWKFRSFSSWWHHQFFSLVIKIGLKILRKFWNGVWHGSGPEFSVISFNVGKKDYKGGRSSMWFKIVCVEGRFYVGLDSTISPVTLKRLPESKCQKEYAFWEMLFQRLYQLILNQFLVTLNKISIYHSRDG